MNKPPVKYIIEVAFHALADMYRIVYNDNSSIWIPRSSVENGDYPEVEGFLTHQKRVVV